MFSLDSKINVSFLVRRQYYGQGMTDGRVPDQSLNTSGSIPGHTKQFARLFHPFKSWCAGRDDDAKYFKVDFMENRLIAGIGAAGDPLEHKYIFRAKIKAYVDKKWETVRDKSNQEVSTLFRQ